MSRAKRHIGSASHSYALAVLDYFEQRREDPAHVFGEALVAHIRLGQDAERLSIAQWQDMLQRAATIRPRHLGMLGFLLMSCDTLGAAAASTVSTRLTFMWMVIDAP